ncbi:hypothetical protein FB567DRAFT_587882 [Paraphoma chrysanthemicola]|uniref:Uncharacterized protein n=1 Tax=Paraphoma chrysanthemicola TaxID=798071 RepID=A0A8K0RFA4_9PLEO|nr:hypothetical protein FB567DRAFT_587882 [Paraphoma chrysanthemicola]
MSSPFLRLAPELRNRIYHYEAQREVRIRPAPKEANSALIPYASLAEVCKQIRAEYRTFQRHEVRVQVHWKHAEKFMIDFMSTKDDLATPPRILRIAIDFNLGDVEQLEILPILRVKAAHPSFHCRFSFVTTAPSKWNWFLEQFIGPSYLDLITDQMVSNQRRARLNANFDSVLENWPWLREAIDTKRVTSVKISRLYLTIEHAICSEESLSLRTRNRLMMLDRNSIVKGPGILIELNNDVEDMWFASLPKFGLHRL